MVRRRALHVLGVSLAAAGGLLPGCNRGGGQGGAAGAGSCQDKIEVDESAATLRRTLHYKEKADAPEKKCSLCAQFEVQRYAGTGCGGCKLFAGAVSPEGGCLSFAPAAAGVPVPAAGPAKSG